jgi:anaerobic dimethyl sulfoxide reductase subunit B
MAEQQIAFYVNLNLCTGCKACQVACKDKSNLPIGVTWRRVAEYVGGNWSKDGNTVKQNVFAYYVSTACNHCQNPICVEVCPVQAMTKRADGVVVIDAEKCIGCRYCEWACPYGAPQFDQAEGKMTKCNFCYDLLDTGQNPACVMACPSRAIEFGELTDLQAKYGTVNEIEPLPDSSLTEPSLVLTPHRSAQPSGTGSGKLGNPEEV